MCDLRGSATLIRTFRPPKLSPDRASASFSPSTDTNSTYPNPLGFCSWSLITLIDLV